MSATVAAALKKIAVALLTDKKALKTIGGIVLGVLIIIIMPIVAVVSLFNGGIEIDTDRLQTMVVENLSAEEQAKLQAVEDTMYAIEDAMLAAGFPARVKEAQVLYVLALSDFADDNGFVEKLVGCFTAEQTDAQLISAVNSAFGTSLAPEDFTQVMQAIRAVYIDTSHYTGPSTKNNLDLVQWAIAAEKAGWGYVWGTFGEVLTESYYEAKAAQYPDEVGGYEDFIRQNWLGGRTADCVGFIKGYGWLNSDTHEIEYGTNGMPDIGADAMYDNATEKGTIDTMDEAERLALPHPECEARNLFVRESRTHRYFLLTAHARVDLKAFSRQQGLRSLSFASADELREILWLETGAVTPLALLNAPDVTLYLDEALLGGRIAVHPNTNTATVWLQTADLVSLLRTQCVPVVAVPFPCLP